MYIYSISISSIVLNTVNGAMCNIRQECILTYIDTQFVINIHVMGIMLVGNIIR